MKSAYKQDIERQLFKSPVAFVNQKISLVGRVVQVRKLGRNLTFLLLKTSSGSIQCVSNEGGLSFQIGSLISVSGQLQKAKVKSGLAGFEISTSSVRIISDVQELPFTDHNLPRSRKMRLRYRHVDLRSPRPSAIFKIRSEMLRSAREFFWDNDFQEVTTPRIVGGLAHGPVKKLELDYFGKPAFLTIAGSLYHGILISGDMYRVFEIGPVFYGENSNNAYNLNEFSVIEFAMAFGSRNEVMELTNGLITTMIDRIRNRCEPELETLQVEIPDFGRSIPRMSYTQMIDFLNHKGCHLKWGSFHEMPANAVKKIEQEFDTYFWLVDQPAEQKWFFVKTRCENNKHVAEDCQLWYPRAPYRLAEGAEREVDPELIVQRIRAYGLDPKSFEAYVNAMRHGAPPFSGIGIGVERFLALILNEKNIREVVLFPRDPDTIDP